ncbi:MAG TPA: CRISPR-associated protein Cas5 [Nitrososphaeraceae archaeon]|nr:CRISPR-associated protein Cas5 [Nitrososphaeraceae archaeon]
MQVVCLRVKGNFNSFRISSGIRYQRTYYIPTKTTLIGLLGSALGLDDKELQNLFSSIKTNAILDSYSGIANDLWLITKLKTRGKPESSPIIREMLFEPQYSIYYSIANSSTSATTYGHITLDDIIDAFYDPVYPLSLGRSDEMIEVKELRKVNIHPALSTPLPAPPSSANQYFKNTILPFNFKEYFDKYEHTPLRKGYTFSLPQVMSIPISFKIEDNGTRRPSKYMQVTMVYDKGVVISGREDSWLDEHRKFFLY